VSLGNTQRLYFFDNLRYLMIVFVVLGHTAIGYSHIIPWWPVIDSNQSVIFDILLAIGEIFTVPVLFFVSGFFVISSIKRRGVLSFLHSNLIRLGLVWLIIVLLVNPVFSYLFQYTRNHDWVTGSYGDFWIQYMLDTIRFKTGYISTMDMLPSDQPKIMSHFNQYHVWFISLLMSFFCFVCLACGLNKAIDYCKVRPMDLTRRIKNISPRLILSLMALFMAISVYVAHFYIYTYSNYYDPWVSIGHLLQFQPTRFFIYFFSFLLGIFAFLNQWFQNDHSFIERPWVWIISCGLLAALYLLSIDILMNDPTLLWLGIYSIARSLLCVTSLVVILSLARRHWNKTSTLGRLLSGYSFNVYLIHLIFVVMLQWLMLGFAWPGIAKWIFISILSLIVSYAICHYVIDRSPRIFAVGFLSLFISIIFIF